MKKLISVLLIFIPEILFAANKEWKSGYVVTTQNDTIKGYIAYRKSMEDQKTCLFKKELHSSEITYTPNDLLAYRYDDGLYFQSRNVNAPHLKGKYFIECLLEGIINLYCAQIDYSKEMDDLKSFSPAITAFLAEIPESEYWVEMICPEDLYNNELESKRNDQKLTSLFFDKIEELKNDIPKASYKRDKMTTLFKKYHDLVCTDRECVLYKEKKKEKIRHLAIYTGAGFQWKSSGESIRATTVHLGAGYSIALSKFSDRILFNSYLGLTYLNDNDPREAYKLQTLGLFNQFSLEGRLMFPKVQPLLEAGFYQQVHFIPIKSPDYPLGYTKYTMGMALSAGLVIKTKKGQIPIKINGYFPFVSTPSNIILLEEDFLMLRHQCLLSIGYRFRIK